MLVFMNVTLPLFKHVVNAKRFQSKLLSFQVEALEEKIKTEMETLMKRTATMRGEMETLSDIDSLRDHAQKKRVLLDEERKILLQLKAPAQLALSEVQMKLETLQVRLSFLHLRIFKLIKINYVVCRNQHFIFSQTSVTLTDFM